MDLIEVADVRERLDALLGALRSALARITPMNDILVPISPGELLDKITILRIKWRASRMRAKLANVRLELALLEQTWHDCGCAGARDGRADERALQGVNERLWDIEDRIREQGGAADLRPRLHRAGARGLPRNDERAAIKQRINLQLGSRDRRGEIVQAVRR